MNAIQFFQWGNDGNVNPLEKILTELNSKDFSVIKKDIKCSAIADDYGFDALLDGITSERKEGKLEKIIIKFKFSVGIGDDLRILFVFNNVPYFFTHLEQTKWFFEDKEMEDYSKQNTQYSPFYVNGRAKISKLYQEKEIVTLKIVKK